MRRTYSDLLVYDTLLDRYKYLRLGGGVGEATFGFDRYMNQMFYKSREWRHARRDVILRDNGCDLGVPGYEIHSDLYVHHINPIIPDDIEEGNFELVNPDNLITVSHATHNAIHYGTVRQLPRPYTPRSRNDTRLW